MRIPVLIQAENGNGYRAEVLQGQQLTAEGITPEDAIENLRELIQTRIQHGAQLAFLELEEIDNPWLKLAGVYESDPHLEDYKQALADYRKQVDDDPDRL